jgi:hypothetical protein
MTRRCIDSVLAVPHSRTAMWGGLTRYGQVCLSDLRHVRLEDARRAFVRGYMFP